MRFAIMSLVLLAALGCTREDGAAVPDRDGHAYRLDGASATSGADVDLVDSYPTPGAGETTRVFESGDRLYRIADEHGVTLRWLIERNDIADHPPRPGDRLIVPRRR